MIWLLLVAVGLLVIMYATIVLIEGWASDRLRGIIALVLGLAAIGVGIWQFLEFAKVDTTNQAKCYSLGGVYSGDGVCFKDGKRITIDEEGDN